MVALINTFGMHFGLFLCLIILANIRRSNGQTTTTTTTGTTSSTTDTTTTTPTTGASTECVKAACNTENMPQLAETDALEIKIYYHGMNDQASNDLETAICGLVSTCGDQITVKYMMGAFTETSDNDLLCGAYGCDRDRIAACQQLLAPDILNDPCVTQPILNKDDLVSCLTDAEVDSIILANGEARRALGIQACEVPMVVFNDSYDPCVDISSSDTLISYVCDMYGSALACCSA